jgi:hypothetical protein
MVQGLEVSSSNTGEVIKIKLSQPTPISMYAGSLHMSGGMQLNIHDLVVKSWEIL